MHSNHLTSLALTALVVTLLDGRLCLAQTHGKSQQIRNDRVSASKLHFSNGSSSDRKKKSGDQLAQKKRNAVRPSASERSRPDGVAQAERQKLKARPASFVKPQPNDSQQSSLEGIVQLSPTNGNTQLTLRDGPVTDSIGDESAQASDDDANESGNENEEEAGDDEAEEEEEEEPWTIFQFPRLEQRDIHVRGWLAQSFTCNPENPTDRSNGVMGMNDRANDYLFNQLGLTIENPVQEDSCQWSLGWRMGLMYGSDARFVQSLGFDDEWISGRYVSMAMPEMFADVFVPWGNGASIRIGRFWSPIGYEGVPALDRFFHSATNVFMLAEPSTHTGTILKYPLNEQWTAQAGVVQGWDVWNDNNNSLGGIGTLGWVSPDERTTATGVFYRGDETDDINDNQCTYSFMFTHELNDCWSYLFWHDYNTARNVAVDLMGSPKDGQWFSFTNALFLAVNDQVSMGTRFECYRDDDGVTIYHPITEANLGPGDLFGLTFGLNYTPTLNLLIRPEVRWDWANRVLPYADQTDSHQFTTSCDVVIQF